MTMHRWGVPVTLVIVVVAVLAYGWRPAPQPVRVAKPRVPDTAVARGRLVYERYGCTLCHGPEGKGGLANANALRNAQVPSIIEVADLYKTAEVVQLIRAGHRTIDRADAAGAVPPYRMPGWGDRMSEQEIKDVAEYVMSLFPKNAKKKGWS